MILRPGSLVCAAMDNVRVIRCPAIHKCALGQEKKMVSIKLDRSASANSSSQTLQLSVTCDDDPFFFFALTLSEEGFSQLRAAQGLLVDFVQFPHKLAELVQLCVTESSQPVPRFSLHVDTTSGGSHQAVLDVVEANPFKHLSHISVKLTAASEPQLRQYLAETIQRLKADLAGERRRFASCEETHTVQLRHTQELLSQRSCDLERTQRQLEQLTASGETQLEERLAAERARAQQDRAELERQLSGKRVELEEQHQLLTRELQQRSQSLDKQCRQLTELKYKQELRVRELDNKLRAADAERVQLRQEIGSLRAQSQKLDEQYHVKAKTAQELKTHVAVLQTELKDVQHLLQRQEQLQQSATSSKEQLEGRVSELQTSLTKREKSVRTVSQDLIKANDIIRKLQTESKAHHAKLKLHGQIAVEQERLLADTAGTRDQLQAELAALKLQEGSWRQQLEQLQTSLDESIRKTDAAEKQAKTNDQVIAWLNKQLNEVQLEGGASTSRQLSNASSTGIARPRRLLTSMSSVPELNSRLGECTPVSSTPLASSVRLASRAALDPASHLPTAKENASAGPSVNVEQQRLASKPTTTAATGSTAAAGDMSQPFTPAAAVVGPAKNTAPGALTAQYLQSARGGMPPMAGLVRRVMPAQR